MNEIDICLNCTQPECTGDYPECLRSQQKKYAYSQLKELHGKGTDYVCQLVKQGLNRRQIAEVTGAKLKNITALVCYAVKKGLLTEEEAYKSRERYPVSAGVQNDPQRKRERRKHG